MIVTLIRQIIDGAVAKLSPSRKYMTQLQPDHETAADQHSLAALWEFVEYLVRRSLYEHTDYHQFLGLRALFSRCLFSFSTVLRLSFQDRLFSLRFSQNFFSNSLCCREGVSSCF